MTDTTAPPPDGRWAALAADLGQDLHQVRVGNSRPERVPVFHDAAHGDHYVRFADLSTDVRRILDRCPEVDVRVDGVRFDGACVWRPLAGGRGPVLRWQDGPGTAQRPHRGA